MTKIYHPVAACKAKHAESTHTFLVAIFTPGRQFRNANEESDRVIDLKTSNLVTVGRAYSGSTAAQVMAMLESSGIKVFAHPWHMQAMQWNLTHALGGIELQVPASQVELADVILADVEMTSLSSNRLLMLLIGVIGVIGVIWVAVPPPPSGFFAAVRRPAAASQLAEKANP